MKIKLKIDLPIQKQHGATKGRVFEVLENRDKYSFFGDADEVCRAFPREVEIVDDEGDDNER